MRTLKLFTIVFLAVAISFSMAQKLDGIPYGTADALEVLNRGESPLSDVEIQVDPSYEFDKADHVANGIAMRNRTSGTIHLRGVPKGGRVVLSLLYWNFSDNNATGKDTMPILFDGNLVVGRKTADNPDPCWGLVGNHSYVADVTQYTDQTGTPNQDYDVVMVFNEKTVTSGENPWTTGSGAVNAEGASLIVVYQGPDTVGSLAIYDQFSGTTFTNSFNGTLINPSPIAPSQPDLFTMVGADGQLGGGYSIGLTNELTFFNGNQIAGPPVTNSDWDGSDGWPLVQLWDTHTHEVKISGSVSRVTYQTNGDCLVPVALVLDDR